MILLLCLLLFASSVAASTATEVVVLDTLEVVAKDGTKQNQPSQRAVPYYQIAQHALPVPKDVTVSIPNLYMPSYGSSMTSSIYVRGLGSRLDQPVVQIIVDGVPLLDKNAFDADLLDLRQVTFLPGAQATMYGRNAMGGVLNLTTLQPMDFYDWSLQAKIGYSTANTVKASASVFQHVRRAFAYTVGAAYRRTDGFYTNAFNGSSVDAGQSASGRVVLQWLPQDHWTITATTNGSWTKEGAFPYASAQSGIIAYNSPSSYLRYFLSQSVKAVYESDDYHAQIVGSYQFLEDDMVMDQDYTPAAVFTLNQHQRQHNVYVDGIIRSKRPVAWYDWSVGVTGYGKFNTMSAPVTFLREGIESLILDNANKGIRTAFPADSLEISETQMPIYSHFDLTNIAAAVYHQSTFTPIEGLSIQVGLRADVEYSAMRYNASAQMNYRMTAFMAESKTYQELMSGDVSQTFFRLLPKVQIRYDWEKISLSASVARGTKAGGYNPQIFSTIMQNRMMQGLMNSMGVHLASSNSGVDLSSVSITSYRPESAWTTELNVSYRPFARDEIGQLTLQTTAFYSDVRDQQVTVFPSGKTTGRMMSNASHARSAGCEATARYVYRNAHWTAVADLSYGFTDARFITFDNGMGVYDDNVVPYAPRHTFSASVQGSYSWNNDWSLQWVVSTHGKGKLFWDEANTHVQPYYQVLDASVAVSWQFLTLQLWARNIIDTSYDVFYFVSMENAFLQRGKPRELGLTVTINY